MKANDYDSSKYTDFINHLDQDSSSRMPDILALEQELRSDDEHPTSLRGSKSDDHEIGSFRDESVRIGSHRGAMGNGIDGQNNYSYERNHQREDVYHGVVSRMNGSSRAYYDMEEHSNGNLI